MSKVYIRRVLYRSGYLPFYCEGLGIIKRHFSTLTELKEFYKIKKVKKNGKGWAINSRGTKIEWVEYIAEIKEN